MVRIVADTLSSLSPELCQSLGIPCLPQIVIFGEQSYRDDTEMNSIEFLKRLATSPVLPKTAAPPPALYGPIYQELSANGNTVIVLTPSCDVSGTFRSAEVAAKDFPEADIRVIDTRSIAANLGEMVLAAHRWAQEGMPADEIIAGVREMSKRERTYFAIDTLEYLHKGGRIGGAQLLMGSLLQVKPILQFKNGRIETLEQQRTKRRAVARLKELIISDCPPHPDCRLHIIHGGIHEEAKALGEEMREKLNLSEVIISDLPPAVLVHSGPGVLGATFFTDKA